MAKAAPATPVVKVPAITTIPQGFPFVVHTAGTATYESLRTNGKIDLELDDGSIVNGIVEGMQVGALIDLISGTGQQSITTYGRIYSPLALVQALTDASSENVLDVTKLYTAVTVRVPQVTMGVV